MKKAVFFLVFVSFHLLLNAQIVEPSFDSLTVSFRRAPSDTAKLRILFANKPMKYTDRADELLKLYQEGYILAKRQNDKINRFKAVHYTAMTYLYGKVDESTAFKWLQKAMIEAEFAQNNLFIGWVYYAMSIIHHHQQNRAEMYRLLYKSVEALEKAPDPVDGPFIALSQNLDDDKKWNEQLAVNKRLVALMIKTTADVFPLITSYNSLVDALKHHPDKKKEMNFYHKKVMELVDKVSMTDLYPDDELIVASIYFKNNRPALALKHAKRVANLPEKTGFNMPVKGTAYKLLAEIYESQKQYPLALESTRKYQAIEIQEIEKRLTDDAGKKVIKAEAEYNVAMKQKEIEKQQLLTYLAASIAILILFLSGSIYYFYRREQGRKLELQRLNTTKDKLFAILSHDLRSPIMSLKNHLMLVNWGALNQEEFNESAQYLNTQLGNVFDMLENLLNWVVSQLGGIHPNKENVSILPIVEEQLQLLSSAANTKEIALHTSINAGQTLIIDKNHLAVILRNILQNAIKFTPKGGNIQLDYGKDGKGNYIEVKDTGIGMPAEKIKRLFRLDTQTSRTGTANEKGTGLGLILVKELVEANGGTVQVVSIPKKGTTFRIFFKQ